MRPFDWQPGDCGSDWDASLSEQTQERLHWARPQVQSVKEFPRFSVIWATFVVGLDQQVGVRDNHRALSSASS